MKTSNVIVIGSGLAGLMAASVAASRKQKVTVLTYGSGSLPLTSGAIDFGSFENLLVHHPYKKIGSKNIDAAAKFLCDIAAQANFPYVGKPSSQIPIVTAVGTLKYSVLVPESMNAGNLANKKKIFVVEIKGLKDFLRRNDCRQS